MYSYASRVPPGDRWAIAAYIRALAAQPARHGSRTCPPKTGAELKEADAMSRDATTIAAPDDALRARLDRLQTRALLVGGVGPGPLRRWAG